MKRFIALCFIVAAFTISKISATSNASFVLFSNVQYVDISQDDLPLVRSNIIYESPFPELKQGRLPDETHFKDVVSRASRFPGPIALDFESIYLRGDKATAESHAELLVTLAKWTREAVPGKAIGFYGLLSTLDPQYDGLARKVDTVTDIYFPSMYTFDDDRAKWTARLDRYLARARSLDPTKRVYPYIWPQYHDKSNRPGQFIDADYWTYQLKQLQDRVPAAVIWSKKTTTRQAPGWISATRNSVPGTAPQKAREHMDTEQR